MKEYDIDNNKELNAGNNNSKGSKLNSGKKAKKTPGYIAMYEKCPDIPSRVRFLLDLYKSILIRVRAGEKSVKPTELEIEELKRIADSFILKYVKKGTLENRQIIFETLGRITAENDYDYYREFSEQKGKIKINNELPEVVAKWITDKSEAGVEKEAIEAMTNSITHGLRLYEFYDEISKEFYEEINDESYELKRYYMNNGAKAYYSEKNVSDNLRAKINSIPDFEYDKRKDEIIKKAVSANRVGKRLKKRYYEYAANAVDRLKDVYERGLKEFDKKEDQIILDMKLRYNYADTIEAKMDVIIDSFIDIKVRDFNNVRTPNATEFVYDMISDFTEEIAEKNDYDTINKLFTRIGKLGAENMAQLTKLHTSYREEFESEGKTGIKKADALAWASLPGIKAQAFKNLNKRLQATIQSKSRLPDILFKNAGITKDTSIKEYYEKVGKEDTWIEEYISRKKIRPEDSAYSLFFPENTRQNEEVAMLNYMYRFTTDVCNTMIMKGEASIISSLDDRNKKFLKEVSDKVNTEIDVDSISDWLNGEGKRRYDNVKSASFGRFYSRNIKVNKKTKSYDNYIKLHTGDVVCEYDEEKRKDCLMKALAANALKNSGMKFAVDNIHKLANDLKKQTELIDMMRDKDEVIRALSSRENLGECMLEIFGAPYKVKPIDVSEYIEAISTLAKNMMTSEGRSKKYKAFTKAVEDISRLKGMYDFSLESDREAASKRLTELNLKLVTVTQSYISGKEKVRTSDSGKERFNNAIDALAILSEYTAGVAGFVKRTVVDINAIRKAEAGSEKYIDISAYGAKRAVSAKRLREAAVRKNVTNKNGKKHI